MLESLVHHIDKYWRNREREGREESDLEVETKLTQIGDPAVFKGKIEELGAKQTTKRRKITDERYVLNGINIPEITIADDVAENPTEFAKLKKALELLGLEISEPENHTVKIRKKRRVENIEHYLVRLRTDEIHGFLFSVKGPTQKDGNIKSRREIEAKVTPKAKGLLVYFFDNFLKKNAAKSLHIEKYRTSYEANLGQLGLLKIEIDELPLPEVPAWAEFEAQNTDAIRYALKKFGYSGQTTSMSQEKLLAKFFKEKGITADPNNIREAGADKPL